jgi:hypothetical protein
MNVVHHFGYKKSPFPAVAICRAGIGDAELAPRIRKSDGHDRQLTGNKPLHEGSCRSVRIVHTFNRGVVTVLCLLAVLQTSVAGEPVES